MASYNTASGRQATRPDDKSAFCPEYHLSGTRKPLLSGPIWGESPRRRGQIVRRVCEALGAAYGTPRLGNPKRPVDDLVYIMLSNKTAPRTAARVYSRMKQRFPSWQHLLDVRPSALRSLLRPAGLSRVKSTQLRRAVQKIVSDFGRCSLHDLASRPVEDAEAYLTSLPGVSLKVAKCVVMYTLGAHVLPVDAHVHRVAGRLGWTARKRADQCHEELELLVPPHRRFGLHVGCVSHGRKVCRPARPLCEMCCIRAYCRYTQADG